MFMSHFLAIIFYSRETWRSWKSRIIVLEKLLFGAPENTWIPYRLSSGRAFCLLRTTWLLTYLVNDFVRLLPIGQVSFKSYSLSKKIYLSQANGRDFFQALLLCETHAVAFASDFNIQAWRWDQHSISGDWSCNFESSLKRYVQLSCFLFCLASCLRTWINSLRSCFFRWCMRGAFSCT